MEYITQIFYIMVAYICLHLLETGMAKRRKNERMLGVLPPKTWNDLIIIGLVIYGAYLLNALHAAGEPFWDIKEYYRTSTQNVLVACYAIINSIQILGVPAFLVYIVKERTDGFDLDELENLIPFANKPLLFTLSKDEKIAKLKAQIEKAEGSR